MVKIILIVLFFTWSIQKKFEYNPMGQRVLKDSGTDSTYYVRDAQGNIISVYQANGYHADTHEVSLSNSTLPIVQDSVGWVSAFGVDSSLVAGCDSAGMPVIGYKFRRGWLTRLSQAVAMRMTPYTFTKKLLDNGLFDTCITAYDALNYEFNGQWDQLVIQMQGCGKVCAYKALLETIFADSGMVPADTISPPLPIVNPCTNGFNSDLDSNKTWRFRDKRLVIATLHIVYNTLDSAAFYDSVIAPLSDACFIDYIMNGYAQTGHFDYIATGLFGCEKMCAFDSLIISLIQANPSLIDSLGGVQIRESAYKQSEVHLYGSNRIGMDKVNRALQVYSAKIDKCYLPGTTTLTLIDSIMPPSNFSVQPDTFTNILCSCTDTFYINVKPLGDKRYEFSNHLGNVLAVISDRKKFEISGGDTLHVADVENA